VVNLTPRLLTPRQAAGSQSSFETGRAQIYALIVFGGVIALVCLFSSF